MSQLLSCPNIVILMMVLLLTNKKLVMCQGCVSCKDGKARTSKERRVYSHSVQEAFNSAQYRVPDVKATHPG